MTGAVAGVASPEALGAMAPAHADRSQQPTPDQDAFLDVLDRGLSEIANRPNPQSTSESLGEGFSSEYGGSVGQAKIDMNGGAAPDSEAASAAEGATLEDRLQSLYFELTHYQIAWKIAQNVQRDVSQVLRGS